MTTIALRGGTVVDGDGARRADVLVDDHTGLITAVGPGAGPAERELDASGCFVSPGLVDLNASLGQPGHEGAETIDSGTRAAAVGGYTAVVAMPDTDPVVDSAAVVSELLALAKDAPCEVVVAAAVTVGAEGRALAPLGELIDLGVRLFTDADRGVADAAVVRRALEYAAGVARASGIEVRLAQRGRLDDLAAAGIVNEGVWSSRLGLPGQPAAAEELGVTREIALARLTGAPVHLQQISTAGAVELIRGAKAAGVPVTAEVSPHHLVLDESVVATFDPNVKVDPPLRTAGDIAALRAAVLDGTIDAVATGHRPHTIDAKELPFDQAPFGVVGLETALAVLLTELDAGYEALLPALSLRPARIAGVAGRHGGLVAPGAPANLVVVDPEATWMVDGRRLVGRAGNTAFAGRRLRGRVRHTMRDGDPVVVDGEVTR
ncbi:MAG: dihydroorotase [Acidimicrobiales bacterium]